MSSNRKSVKSGDEKIAMVLTAIFFLLCLTSGGFLFIIIAIAVYIVYLCLSYAYSRKIPKIVWKKKK